MIKIISFFACILLGGLLIAGDDAETSRTIVGEEAVQSSLRFKRVFIVVLENEEFWISNLNSHLNGLSKKGLLLTNYKATTHPSQPNYIAMIAGHIMGVTDDSVHDVEGTNLVDLLEEKDISWKAYQEGYPGDCFDGAKNERYRRKHNPFISFNNIRNNATRCAKIVNSDQLMEDMQSNSLPQFMFYTPDMDNDGHDTGVMYAGKWASGFIHKLLKHEAFSDETLIVLTFDEGLPAGSNMIYTLLIGPGVPTGKMDDTRYNHYSLLRTIEDNFGLGSLGRGDSRAVPFKFKSNPPKFIMTMETFIGIVVTAAIVIMAISVVSGLLIYRRCRRARLAKSQDDTLRPINDIESDTSTDTDRDPEHA